MTTTEKAEATRGDARRGFPNLPCLNCGEPDTTKVNLEDMKIECVSCDCVWDAAELRDTLAAWTRVLDWIELAPTIE